MEEDILKDYRQRSENAQNEVAKYKRLINTYSFLRLGVFALLVAAIGVAKIEDNFTIIAVSLVILLFCFAWLVSRQAEFERQKAYFQNLTQVNENEIKSITQHQNIYDTGQKFNNDKHFYTSDLDIFGNSSLFQLINRCATPTGADKLASWLSSPASKEVIVRRQAAVNDLALKNSWKLDLQSRMLFANNAPAGQFKNLFAYLRLPLDIPGEKWLKVYIKISPFLLFGTIVAAFFYPIMALAAIAIGLFNITMLVLRGHFIAKAGFVADKISGALANYANVFKIIETEQWQPELCAGLSGKLKTWRTSKSIEELSVLINKLGYSAVMIVGFILNLFFLWALKEIIAIEEWKRNNKENLEAAFDVIAEFETLMSLASLRINYPGWCVPEIAETNGYTLVASAIAHPLINRKKRIENDYELDDAFRIDIITGSNMAGKSTFLRTIGINTVLALCGAPVCARKMSVSEVVIISYMRIKDALDESTSTFKAELDRLQMLLKAVESGQKVFFLIDEMLRGTNSVDKYLGSKAVIERLISKNGVGMVATHDLQIAELETKYPDYIRNFYFDIQIKNGEMLFDYKIKHGECKTFNATLLLKQIGIDVGE